MTLNKIAFTVLGTVALTAGTVFAFAEPTPSQLPEAAAAKSAGCPKCAAGPCGTAKCDVATKCPKLLTAASANSVSACGTACGKAMVGAGVNSNSGVVGTVVACEAETCKARQLDEEAGPCLGLLAGAAAHAYRACEACDEILGDCSTAAATEKCPSGVCAAQAACPTGQSEPKKRTLTLRFGITSNGPSIQLTSGTAECPNGVCTSPASTCEKACSTCEKACGAAGACECPVDACDKETCSAGACEKGCCEKTCDEAHHVAATACEAQPACAVSACPASVCAVTGCDGSQCAEEACVASKCRSCTAGVDFDFNVADIPDAADIANGSPACTVAACDCDDCCCESCDCTSDAACPAGSLCPVASRVQEFFRHEAGPVVVRWKAPSLFDDVKAAQADEVMNHASPRARQIAERIETAPGRVRLSHFPDLRFRPSSPDFAFPSNVLYTSFAAPVAAPLPAATPAARHGSVHGTWSRKFLGCAIDLTVEQGRMRGTWTGSDEFPFSIRFSGTCTVDGSGQVFGVLDEVSLTTTDESADEQIEAQATATRLVDQPFAFRFTTDGRDLIVKDFRCGGLSAAIEEDASEFAALVTPFACGRFERAE